MIDQGSIKVSIWEIIFDIKFYTLKEGRVSWQRLVLAKKLLKEGSKRLRSYLKIQFLLGLGERIGGKRLERWTLVSLKDHWWGGSI